MKLEVKTKKFFSSEELKQKIDLFHVPALILGNDFKILAKSNSFADSKAFRIGARFDKLLKPYDRERLCLLEEGNMLVADLTTHSAKGYATVIRGDGCFLVCFRYLADGLVERIFERLNKLSGYDIGVNAYISAIMSDVGNTHNGKRLSAVIERLFIELADVHRLSFFDFSATLSSFFFALGEVAPDLLRRIDMPKILPETVALGCGNDILLISAYVLALCADSGCGNIGLSASDCDGGIRMTFTSTSVDESGDAFAFANALRGRNSFDKPLDRATFWAFFARLIADTNLWEISASNHGERFAINFFIPSVARGEEFYLRDSETLALRSVLEYFFCK